MPNGHDLITLCYYNMDKYNNDLNNTHILERRKKHKRNNKKKEKDVKNKCPKKKYHSHKH